MTPAEVQIIINIFFTSSGFVLSYFIFKRGRDKELKSEASTNASELAIIQTKLNHITSSIEGARVDIKTQQVQINEMSIQQGDLKAVFKADITRLDESGKQAHKRIDHLEVLLGEVERRLTRWTEEH